MEQPETIHAGIAKPENGMVKLVVVIDGKPRVFLVAKHVAAALVGEMAKALSLDE